MHAKQYRRMALGASAVFTLSASLTHAATTAQSPEVLVSATRFEEMADRIAVNATVISREEIARSAGRTLAEIVGARAGVFSRDLFGNAGALASVDMRGFGAAAANNTLVLIDGRRLNDMDQSGVQWSSIPLETIERIEIMRGSGAVQYGDGASAGAINIITRHPAKSDGRGTGSISAGSHDTRELTLAVNAFGQRAGVNAFGRHYESAGYRDNNRNRQTDLVLGGSWSGDRADASWRIAADRQGLRLPGARQVQPSAGVDELKTARRGTSTPLDFAQRDGNQATLDVRWPLAGGELIVGLGYRDKTQRSYFDFGGFPDYRDVNLDVLHLQPRYRWHGQGWGGRHTLVAGVDLSRWDYALSRSDRRANIGRPFNRIEASQHNEAVYLLDTVQLGERIFLNAGARREWQRMEASDVFDPSAPGGAFGSAATAGGDRNRAQAYELGVRVGMSAQASLIGRVTRSFRFANVDEIYETSPSFLREFQFLQPQRATTYELGIALGAAAPWLQASVFHMRVTDEIRLDPYSTGVGNRNMPPLERIGLELEARRPLTRQLEVSGTYTYTRARFEDGILPGSAFTQADVEIGGRTVPLVPRHKIDLALDWRIGPHTRLRGELRYLGEQFMENDEGNTFAQRIPSHSVTDLKLQHRVGAFTASLGIANLFDRKYYTYAVRSQFVADRFNAYPLPERTFWLGVAYKGW